MSWSANDYPFNENFTSSSPGPAYQIVQSLPTPSPALRGTIFFLEGPPDVLYVLRENAQGTLVYTQLARPAIRLKMCSADFTPQATGRDNGGLAIVPYSPFESILTPINWTVVDIVFRVEAVASSGTTGVQIARSVGTGPFVNAGYINATPVTIAAGLNEPTVRPALISNPVVQSGDKLAPVYTSLGFGASGYTLYVVLAGSP